MKKIPWIFQDTPKSLYQKRARTVGYRYGQQKHIKEVALRTTSHSHYKFTGALSKTIPQDETGIPWKK
jgi:hypothetical protein